MPTIDTVVIGAGHAGLAVSRLLTDAGRDHVVLDRGRVGERWRSERWDSLHLLTPNWMTRLPGWWYAGPDPDGFMSAGQLRPLPRAATPGPSTRRSSSGTTVLEVGRRGPDGYRGRHRPGHLARPARRHRHRAARLRRRARRALAAQPRSRDLATATATRPSCPPAACSSSAPRRPGCRSPTSWPAPAATSTLAVGRHTRMPRRYRGMDIFWWLEVTGRLARTIDEMPDPVAARREPSLQLVGRTSRAARAATSTSAACSARGVRLVGRLQRGRRRHRRGSATTSADTIAAAERRMHRFLDAVDATSTAHGLTREVLGSRPAPPGRRCRRSPRRLDLRAEGIGTVVWRHRLPAATTRGCGCRSSTPDGDIRQQRGVTAGPGLYVVGPALPAPPRLRLHRRRPPRRARRRRTTCIGRPGRADSSADCPSEEPRHDRLRRRRRRRPGRRRLHRAAAGPRRACGWRCVDRSRATAPTPLSTHALMRAGRAAAARAGACSTRCVAAGTPPVRRTAFHYADGDPPHVSIRPSAGRRRALRAAPHLLDRILVDAGRGRGRRRAPRDHGHRAARPGPARPGRRGAGALRARRACTCRAPTHRRRRRHPLARRARGRGARRTSRGRTASAVLYRYVADLPADGYEWAYGPGAAAGLIPTNDGRTCVFVGTTAVPDAGDPQRDGTEAAFGALLRQAAPAAAPTRSPPPGRRAGCTAGRRPGLRPPGLGARAGRWSATPATSRTRSPPTASPTRCATPSCSRTRCVAGGVGGDARRRWRPTSARATGCRPGSSRPPRRSPATTGTPTACRTLLAPGQLGDERRGRPPARPADADAGARPGPDSSVLTAVPARDVALGSGREGPLMTVQVRVLGGFEVTVDDVPGAAGARGRAVRPPRLVKLLALSPRPAAAPRAGDRGALARTGPGRRRAAAAQGRPLRPPRARRRTGRRGAPPRGGHPAARRGRSGSTSDDVPARRRSGPGRRHAGAPPCAALASYAGPLLPDDLLRAVDRGGPARPSGCCTSTCCGRPAAGRRCCARSRPTSEAHLALARDAVPTAATSARRCASSSASTRRCTASSAPRPSREAQELRAELERTPAPGAGARGARLFGRRRSVGDRVRATGLAAPRRGRGGTLVVSGPPGVGKTAVLDLAEALARRRGWRTGRGTASAVEGAWPYAPVLEALADLCRQHPALLDGLDDVYRERDRPGALRPGRRAGAGSPATSGCSSPPPSWSGWPPPGTGCCSSSTTCTTPTRRRCGCCTTWPGARSPSRCCSCSPTGSRCPRRCGRSRTRWRRGAIGTRVELAPLPPAATRRLLADRFPELPEDDAEQVVAGGRRAAVRGARAGPGPGGRRDRQRARRCCRPDGGADLPAGRAARVGCSAPTSSSRSPAADEEDTYRHLEAGAGRAARRAVPPAATASGTRWCARRCSPQLPPHAVSTHPPRGGRPARRARGAAGPGRAPVPRRRAAVARGALRRPGGRDRRSPRRLPRRARPGRRGPRPRRARRPVPAARPPRRPAARARRPRRGAGLPGGRRGHHRHRAPAGPRPAGAGGELRRRPRHRPAPRSPGWTSRTTRRTRRSCSARANLAYFAGDMRRPPGRSPARPGSGCGRPTTRGTSSTWSACRD